MNDTYFSGAGEAFIAPVVNGVITKGFRPLGTCDKFDVSNDQTFDDILETKTGQGHVDAHIPTRNSAKVEMNLKKWSVENLMQALYGTSTGAEVGGSATAEAILAFPDSFAFLKHQNVSAVVLTAGATPLVAGTDYTVDLKNGTIQFLAGSTVVAGPGSTAVSAAYTYAAHAGTVHAFASNMQEYAIRLVGFNRADPTAPQIVDLYRVALDLTKTLALMSDSHGSLSVSGMLLLDTTRPAGESQFFSIRKN